MDQNKAIDPYEMQTAFMWSILCSLKDHNHNFYPGNRYRTELQYDMEYYILPSAYLNSSSLGVPRAGQYLPHHDNCKITLKNSSTSPVEDRSASHAIFKKKITTD